MNKRLFNQQPDMSRTNMNTARNSQRSSQPTTQTRFIKQPTPSIESLRNQIRKLETASRPKDTRAVSTGCAGLDQLLPEFGLATGTISEWLTSSAGHGAELLSLLAAREACAGGGALVVIDPDQRFNPAAAAAWGVQLDNVIVIRQKGMGSRQSREGERSISGESEGGSGSIPDLKSRISNSTARTESPIPSFLWAIDQALRCPAVAAVWGRMGHVHERWLRRFQLSAEQSGAMGMFVRPLGVKGQPGWSEVQWEVGEIESQISNLKSQIPSVPSEIPDLKSRISNSIARTEPRPPRPRSPRPLSPRSRSPKPRMTEPMRRAYQRVPQPPPTFDRLIALRLLRVRGGQPRTDRIVQVQIDFTTGKAQTVAQTVAQTANRNDEQSSQTRSKNKCAVQKHSLRVASQLAHPKIGRRQQRA